MFVEGTGSRKVSVIIPVCNEAARLPTLFSSLDRLPLYEIIIVDCGSSDGTWPCLQKWEKAVKTSPLRVITSAPRGRGTQMNAGAKLARGDILLFLHADSSLPENGIEMICKTMLKPDVVGGAFRLKINAQHLFLKFVTWIANLRSFYMKLPYGDQGYFVRRDCFEQLGGYNSLPLMEDVEFFRRLKKAGKVVLLEKAMMTSARRWRKQGIYFTSFRNMILLFFYFIGVSPHYLARCYDA